MRVVVKAMKSLNKRQQHYEINWDYVLVIVFCH